MYASSYTIIAAGLPYQVDNAVDHSDAVLKFLSAPPIQFGYRQGNYDATDGETVVVIGHTQEQKRDYHYYEGHTERLADEAAEGRKGSVRARRLLKDARANPVHLGDPVTISFVLRARTVFDPITTEQIEHEEHVEPVVRREVEQAIIDDRRVVLAVNVERQHPAEKVLTGVPQSVDDAGVWMHGRLIPWADVDAVSDAVPGPEVAA
jgi:hypothetical protein